MPNFYRMTVRNPCPACGGTHFFKSVPFYEESKGATLQLKCPDTNKLVLVTIHPDEAKLDRTTDLRCGSCGKAFYRIREQGTPEGNLITQYLECENEGCAHTAIRRISLATGRVIQQA